MIKVLLPPSSDVGYALVFTTLIGPLDLSSGRSMSGSTLETELFDSRFLESPGIDGDNNLDQLKTDGLLTVAPLFEDCEVIPSQFSSAYGSTWESGDARLTNLYLGNTVTSATVSSILGFGSGYDRVITYGASSATIMSKSHTYCILSGSTYELIGCTVHNNYRLANISHVIVDLSNPIVSGNSVSFSVVDCSNSSTSRYLDASWYDDKKEPEEILALLNDVGFWPNSYTRAFSFYKKQAPVKEYNTDSLLKEVVRYVNQIHGLAKWPDPYDYGELAREASDKAKTVDTNLIGFIRDLRNPLEMIPKLKNLRQLTKNPKLLKKLKNASDDFLTVKYGWLPTISDLKEIMGAFKKADFRDKNGFKTLNAGHTSSTSQGFLSLTSIQRIKIAVSDESDIMQSFYQRLYNVGAFPTLSNLWDLVPYSFVIDWFVDLGSFLETIDFRLYFATLNIHYVTMSQKDISGLRIVPSNGSPILGNITRVHYHRWVSDQCPVPPLSLTSNMQDFDHWVESGALILQRTH